MTVEDSIPLSITHRKNRQKINKHTEDWKKFFKQLDQKFETKF